MTKEQREKHNAFSRAWGKANPERRRAIKKRWYEKNKEKLHAARRAYRAANREKLDAANRAWAKANPDMVAIARVRQRIKRMNAKISGHLRYHYKISAEDYNSVLELQSGACAICGGRQEGYARTKRLFVDHDHGNGMLRALLCHHCNAGLGYFKESAALFGRALAYLEAFNGIDEKDWPSRVRQVLERLPKEGGEVRGNEGVCESRSIAGSAGENDQSFVVAEKPRAVA